MNLTELVHHLQLAKAFMGTMIISNHYEPFTPVFGQDVVLYVRHELDDTGALGGLVHLEEAIALQAVGYCSEQGESFTSFLGGRNLEPLSSVPPCTLLNQPSIFEVRVSNQLTSGSWSRRSR